MAKINNPVKQFQFNIIIPGINPFLCQKVKLPDNESDMAEHGDTGFLVKTAGMTKLSTLNIEKISPADFPDADIRIWRRDIMNTRIGGGALPSSYKRNVVIQQYGPDGLTVVEEWQYSGCWPQKVNGQEFDRKGSENTITSIEFCVDEEL